jgi:hypothetical protein
MGRMSDFAECLYQRDMGQLRALADCLYQLHEAMADDNSRLAAHLEKQHALLLRKCDLCDENRSRHTVWELLNMVEQAIERREAEMKQHEDYDDAVDSSRT